MDLINKLLSNFDGLLDKSAPYYVYLLTLIHILYVLVFIGIATINTAHLHELNIFMQLFVCLFLIIRFFPMRKYTLKEHDPIIIFGSATFLLLNLGFTEIISQYLPTRIVKVITA